VLGVRANDVTRQVPLAEGVVTLGASQGCSVVLRGRDVAREHAKLHLSPERARLSVFPHAAPAVLNGVQVREAGLEPGDTIQVGDVQLTLHRADVQAAIEAGEVAADEPLASATANGSSNGNGVAPQDALGDRAAVNGASRDRTAHDAAPPASPLVFLERLCHWGLRGASAGRAEMLASLCQNIAADAACVFVAERAGQLTSLAAWGDPLPGLVEAASAVTPRGTNGTNTTNVDEIVVAARPGWAAAGLTTPSGTGFGLFVRGPRLVASTPELLRVATRLFGHDYLRERAAGPRAVPPAPVRGLVFPPDVVVGRSPAMRKLYEELATVVEGNLPVLVLGETGVGKEHIARVLHDSSSRRDRPFVTINCAAIPAELLEAELFGIERGVATGVSERIGKFREAHGGTLFLDEIGELPLPLQSKLLRVLEEKKVQPVGGQAAAVDLRIVAATNVPLDEVTSSGRFRLDLFHRLAGFVVAVPALRERAEDVPLLFDHFLRAARGHGARLAPAALAALVRHRWTGNVRELRHEAARIAARAAGAAEIQLADLSPGVAAAVNGPSSAPADDAADARPRTLDEELARIERALLATALRDTAGNVSHAAQRLGISRARLRRRARELGVERG
jgi:transcriptional regulator with AAA-type ATPase domain